MKQIYLNQSNRTFEELFYGSRKLKKRQYCMGLTWQRP